MLLNPNTTVSGSVPEKGIPDGTSARARAGRFTALVKIDVATVFLNRPTKHVFNLVDGGAVSEAGLLWVFNVARNPAGVRRDLRFWLPELKARTEAEPSQYHRHDIQWVIAQILPESRTNFQAGEVDRLFQVRHSRRLEMFESAGLAAGRNFYSRPMLADFLKCRWLGATNGEVRNA